MTNTIRLYNPDEVQAIVEVAIADTLATSMKVSFKAAKVLKRDKKRIAKRNRIIYQIKKFLVLGLPIWDCLAMVIHWLMFGY